MMSGVINGTIIWITLMAALCLIAPGDHKWQYRLSRRESRYWLMAAILQGMLIVHGYSVMEQGLICILLGLLWFACITDHVGCYVYQVTWWLAWPAGMLLLWIGAAMTWERWLSLGIFVLLQEIWFARMYGRADCHAFVACALLETALGMDMQGYTLHMAVTFILLAVVQGAKHNIDRRGRLIVPKPLLPYIAVALSLMLFVTQLNEYAVRSA